LERQVKSAEAAIAAQNGSGASQAQKASLMSVRNQLDSRLYRAAALQGAAVSGLSVIRSASTPLKPVFPRPIFDSALAFIVGFVLVYMAGILVGVPGRSPKRGS
jgi:uncharacterized protein involved in exopolysaccharide biosynthesis